VNQSTDTLYTQPSPGTQVDYGNPIAHGLWLNYLFNERGGKEALDSSGQSSGVLSFTGTDPEWTQYGLAVGNGKGYVRNNKTVLSTFNPVRGSHTVRVVHIPRTWPGGFTAVLDVAGTAGSGRILNIFADTSGNISYRGIGGADGSASANTVGMELGQVNDLVYVRAFGDNTSGLTHTHYWYLNGRLVHTEGGLSGVAWPTDGYDFAAGGNPTGGGSAYDGQYLQIQAWDRALGATEVAALYSNPYAIMSDGPYYFPAKTGITNATGTATFDTVTLTAPTATAFEVNDATGSASFSAVTLTAPAAVAFENSTGSASFGTVTLTAPTATALTPDNTGYAEFTVVYAYAPTAAPFGPQFTKKMQDVYYWGRFSRGQFLNIIWSPPELPDTIATVDFWLEGTTLVDSVLLPVLDEERPVFGYSMMLGTDFEDGNYVIVIRFSSGTIRQCTLSYMTVQGGIGSQPIISIIELNRTLGRAVVTQDGGGECLIGYQPTMSAYELE